MSTRHTAFTGNREGMLAWRHETRQRLLTDRMRRTVAERQAASALISEKLDVLLGDLSGHIVSGYWPLRGEPDIRPWLTRLTARGVTCVLPLVVEKAQPLRFRAWQPGCRMEKGFWDIPVPAEGDWLTPEVLIAPVVGFDAANFRLGYGGGYFDRTLAALAAPWRAIGVGYLSARLDTIHPLAHDVPMQDIVAA